MPAALKKIKFGSARQKQQLIFLFLAVFMLALTIFLIFYYLTFLVSNFNQALGTLPKPTVPPGFDIQGFQKLQLIK